MADCVRNTIDSNSVGLYFAETICGRLPNIEADGYLPVWYELEPNSYSGFGGGLTTMARAPINASRQRKKGTVTDLDANAGFNQDWTQNNFDRLLQGFFFSNWREKPNTRPINGDTVALTAVTAADDTIAAASGLDIFVPGMLVKTSGFSVAANNGIFGVVSATATGVVLAGVLADEVPPAAAQIEAVGFEFASGGVSLTANGDVATLAVSGAAIAATGTVTVADTLNVAAGDQIIVGNQTYTFVAGTPTAAYEIPVGADGAASAANFAAAINGSVLLTEEHPLVAATDNADGTVTLTARNAGVTGNIIGLATNGDNLSVSGAYLAGGAGITLTGLGLINGEWVYVGGDDANSYFSEDVRGYARLGSVTDTSAVLEKTTFAAATVAAGTLEVQLYFGNVIKNEKEPELIVTHEYEFKRTVGRDADGIQSEYVQRAVASELTLNVPVTDKATADITFVAGDKRNRRGADGQKPGTAVAALGQDAFNTSSDVYRIRMALVDPNNSQPLPFFGYLSEYELTINNNVTGVKGIGKLGNVDVSVGNFEVGGEATAFFTNMEGPDAIRANADVTVDAIFAKQNAGFIWDIPLMSVGGGEITVTPNEPVTIPLEQFGAENDYGYTLLYTAFPYLPDAAMPEVDE